jgi:NADH:quinone reductase (non-electrogenic)
LCTVEAPVHQNIKDTMVASTEQDTIHIFRTLKNTARVFKNTVSKKVVELEQRPGGAKFEDLRELVSGARGRLVYETGDKDYGIWSASIALGLIRDIPTCKELIDRTVAEAEEIIDGISKLKEVKSKL